MAIEDNQYKVFSAEHSTNSLTKTGFKSTHYAIGELIDNSIQSALEDKKNKNATLRSLLSTRMKNYQKLLLSMTQVV